MLMLYLNDSSREYFLKKKKKIHAVVNKREPFTDVKNQTKELAGKKDFQTNTGGEKLWDCDLQRI